MTKRRERSDFDRPMSWDDPYYFQRLDERRAAKLGDMKAKLRKKAGKGSSRDKAQREPQTSIAKVEQDRGRKNSRRKGNRGELDVAVAFSKWCGELVRRTPGSGGWGGSKDFGTTADLICKRKAFPWHVEVKHREGWVLDDLVTGIRKDHDKSIHQWWVQCVQSCPKIEGKNGYTKFKKEPVLAFRRNRQPWLVMFRLEASAIDEPAFLNGIEPPAIFKIANCEVVCDNVIVMLLSDFLDRVDVPEGLKNFR